MQITAIYQIFKSNLRMLNIVSSNLWFYKYSVTVAINLILFSLFPKKIVRAYICLCLLNKYILPTIYSSTVFLNTQKIQQIKINGSNTIDILLSSSLILSNFVYLISTWGVLPGKEQPFKSVHAITPKCNVLPNVQEMFLKCSSQA